LRDFPIEIRRQQITANTGKVASPVDVNMND
jgi:hypothetical protein